MFASTNACALLGIDAVPIRVEVSVQRGLPNLTIVGLRDADAREAKERIRCGLHSIGHELPLQRVTVNLAPADLPKMGASFDLPIVLGILAASGGLPVEVVREIGSHAEIGLDGTLRVTLGTMAGGLVAMRRSWQRYLVPASICAQVVGSGVPAEGFGSVNDVVRRLRGKAAASAPPAGPALSVEAAKSSSGGEGNTALDLADIRGQEAAIQAVQIAAAGGHNLLLYGPPGCGKTMLAQRFGALLPPLTDNERLEVAVIHDAAGMVVADGHQRPFRAPHHTVTQAALVGGGSRMAQVGELSLAHRGVLFLDELPEFRPSALDAMRQPLEEGAVTIRRARWIARFPAAVHLIAAMNLCRCGRSGNKRGEPCTCTEIARSAYRNRVSGPILDRFDMFVRLDAPETDIINAPRGPSSAQIREGVIAARARARARSAPLSIRPRATALFERAAARFALGARTQQSTLRVATTLAHLANVDTIATEHVAAALSLTRRTWTDEDSAG